MLISKLETGLYNKARNVWRNGCKFACVHFFIQSIGELAVGDGRIPIKEVVTKLLSSGYNGYFAIEHFGAGDQIKFMERSARFLKNIEKRVGEKNNE